MTNQIEVTPVIIDDIEFYVSNDGKQVGVSISGLARLCGVDRRTISGLVNELDMGAGKNIPKSLEFLSGKVFMNIDPAGVENRARIISSSSAVKIIEYYAFDSRAKNETAQNTFRKFARKGFEAWVKELTGYQETKKQDFNTERILEKMQEMMEEMKELKEVTVEYKQLKGVTVTRFANLDWMLDDYAKNKIASDSGFITIKDFLNSKKIVPTQSLKIRLGQLVAETYKTTTGKEPNKVTIKKETGGYDQNISAYPNDYLPLIDMCFRKLMSN